VSTGPPLELDPRFIGAVDLIGRTGAQEFQIRYTDDEPVVWVARAQWHGQWQSGSGPDPLAAVFRLCEQVVDGGQCTHCRRPAGFTADFEEMPLSELVCWYQWDPELATFRRGCE
jgi:hypothetical protein